MSTELILVTSFNGGSGKSTVCANLACALAEKETSVLVISLDKYCNGSDILFGCENSFIFDVSDFPEKSVSDICIPVTDNKRVSLAICMPFSKGEGTDENIISFINEAKTCGKYDFIIVDKGMADIRWDIPIIEKADRIFIVSSQSSVSLRSASLLSEMLSNTGADFEKMFLLLNTYHTASELSEYFPGICEIMDEVKLPLVGVVPFSYELNVKQTLAKNIRDVFPYKAFSNIADRILGKDKKILDFLPSKNRRIILNKGCIGGNKI